MWKRLCGVLLCILNFSSLYGRGIKHCCSKTSAACQEKCELLHEPKFYKKLMRRRSDIANKKFTRRWRRLTDVVDGCPRGEKHFWNCLQRTKVWKAFLDDSNKLIKKPAHSMCCNMGRHISCQIKCRTTTNVTELLYNENCNRNLEPRLNQCAAKFHASKQCCHDAPTRECRDACLDYFLRSHNLDGKTVLERKCGTNSHQYKCLMKQSDYKVVIQEYTKCCHVATKPKCRVACQQELQNLQNMTVFFTRLLRECGSAKIEASLIHCITQTSMGPEPQTPVNEPPAIERQPIPAREGTSGSKGCYNQCCYRAKSQPCRSWCQDKTASPSLLGLWDTMYLTCMQGPDEKGLSACMYDPFGLSLELCFMHCCRNIERSYWVLEPCQISTMTEMRFCTNFNNRPLELFRRRDRNGDDEARKLYEWWSKRFVSVLDYTLNFKNVTTCKPEIFKAMACLISIKPCGHNSPRRQVCRSDCEDLLGSCLDFEKMDDVVDVRLLCAAMLSNENQTDCISVRDYVEKPTDVALVPNEVTQPCDNNPCGRKVCSINPQCSGDGILRGCKPYICTEGCHCGNLRIPSGHRVKLRGDHRKGYECYNIKTCKIRRNGKRHNSKRRYHFTDFDGSHRICNEKKRCFIEYGSSIGHGTEVQIGCQTCRCNDGELLCSKESCGIDFNQHNSVSCYFVDPCKTNPCPYGDKCIPKRSLLLKNTSDCPQYLCVSDNDAMTNCRVHRNHRDSDMICGYDAITYKSECFAQASGTAVDHYGPCKAVREHIEMNRCANVICPKVPEGNCDLFQPPGSCCPVCGSMLRILYSGKDLDTHTKYIDGNKPITVLDIVTQMRHLLRVSQCSLYGHRSRDGDLIILLVVNTKKPTERQVHACATEAERINKYINYGSPVVTIFYHLSILKVSRLKKAKWKNNADSSSPKLHNYAHINSLLFLCTLIVVLLSDYR